MFGRGGGGGEELLCPEKILFIGASSPFHNNVCITLETKYDVASCNLGLMILLTVIYCLRAYEIPDLANLLLN